jgi:hypothetical protein
MKNQSISKTNLKKIYDVACTTWKSKIEALAQRDLFGDEVELTQKEIDEMFEVSDEKQIKVLSKFLTKSKNLIDDINSFEDACESLGITDSKSEIKILESISTPSKDKLIALYKLEIIIRALNNGWYPDFKNSSEYKYFNYFRMEGGFSFYTVYCRNSAVTVPSALYLKNKELAEHCAKIAIKEYETLYK